MKLNVRGNKMDITPSIKSYIEEKIGRLDKYLENPNDITANVVTRVRGKDQIVEVTIPIKKIILRGEESHSDLYAAIDLVSNKLERQIRKNKTKMKKSSQKESIMSFNLAVEEPEEEDTKIVKRKEIEMKPMSEEEAILQMELVGHDFYVFKDTKSEQVCIIYKRKDNNYGIIETR